MFLRKQQKSIDLLNWPRKFFKPFKKCIGNIYVNYILQNLNGVMQFLTLTTNSTKKYKQK